MINFSVEMWAPNCRQKREECIRNLAVQEFGHALFDLQSVMNYCNPRWVGGGKLSTNDITGLQD